MTRTVWTGPDAAPPALRERYTRVLRGHLALSALRFPRGVAGPHLDAIARVPLWDAGLDYDHGTGHGVGSFLSVHEGPAAFSRAAKPVPLEAGMILSNEPGYYLPGHYGIRIENLLLVREAEALPDQAKPFLAFETLTLAPYERRLIEPGMLTAAERERVDAYHARVLAEVAPRCDAEMAAWLRSACAPAVTDRGEHAVAEADDDGPLAAWLAGRRVLVAYGLLGDTIAALRRLGIDYMWAQQDWLRAMGAAPEVVRVPTAASVAANAARLRAALVGSERPALVIAHSKGGLEALAALLDPAAAARCAGFVAFQSPFAGSPVADAVSGSRALHGLARAGFRALRIGDGEGLARPHHARPRRLDARPRRRGGRAGAATAGGDGRDRAGRRRAPRPRPRLRRLGALDRAAGRAERRAGAGVLGAAARRPAQPGAGRPRRPGLGWRRPRPGGRAAAGGADGGRIERRRRGRSGTFS